MKKTSSKPILAASLLALALLLCPICSAAQPLEGRPAPLFALTDIKGKLYDLAKLQGQPILILYFFDANSRTSQEGLLELNEWVKQYQEANLTVWGITRSDTSGLKDLISPSELNFPILFDPSDVSDLYNARMILPTVCIIGPRRKVLHFIQGGGKSNEIMLTQLAEVQLQRRKSKVAAEMGAQLTEKNSANLRAKAIEGHAQLQEGEPAKAQATFAAIPADSKEGRRLRQEGMAEVYLAKGEFDQAWATAQKLERSAPQSAAANFSKAKVLLSKGEKKKAVEELVKGNAKTASFTFQKSESTNKQGRLLASSGQTRAAMDLYAQAEEIDPYNIEATSNKGLLQEKEGNLDKALKTYQQALAVDKQDVYAAVFAKRVAAKLALNNDMQEKKRRDALIKELSTRFREERSKPKAKTEDDWTSHPMVLSFINLKESGGLPDRDGFVLVMADQLSEFLDTSGRIKVVDRRMLESIIDELNLGSSQLADPQTALKLGKLFAAKIIVTGTVHYLPGETLLSLRLLDTETSQVVKVLTRQLGGGNALEKELGWLNREILKTVTTRYPLKGYVADVAKDRIMINIGQNQGVVLGTRFAVIQEGRAMTYKGKVLSGTGKKIAQLKVVQVEPEFSQAQIVSQEEPVQKDDKILESMAEL